MVAKFKCTGVTRLEKGIAITMVPVIGGSPENDKFFNLTPYGKIEIGTINVTLESQFVPGAEYYVDITMATAAK